MKYEPVKFERCSMEFYFGFGLALCFLIAFILFKIQPTSRHPIKNTSPIIFKVRYLEAGSTIFGLYHEDGTLERVSPELYIKAPVEERK